MGVWVAVWTVRSRVVGGWIGVEGVEGVLRPKGPEGSEEREGMVVLAEMSGQEGPLGKGPSGIGRWGQPGKILADSQGRKRAK